MDHGEYRGAVESTELRPNLVDIGARSILVTGIADLRK